MQHLMDHTLCSTSHSTTDAEFGYVTSSPLYMSMAERNHFKIGASLGSWRNIRRAVQNIFQREMMINRKQPIRTYQRKTTKKPFTSSLALPVVSIEKYNPVENSCFDKNGTFNDSLNYDRFETTFDRLAKEAIVPPMPLDMNQNDSWNGSSSDSNINNTTNVKSFEHISSDLFTCNSTSSSSHTSKHRRPQRYQPEIIVSKRILPKRARKTMLKNKTQLVKTQDRKKQGNKIQRMKTKYKFKKSSRTCNEQVSYANNTISNMENAIHENSISCNNKNEYLHQSALKIDKVIMSQIESIKPNDSITNFKHMPSCHQNIKPCFVKLNACTVQDYISNREKTMKNKQNILHNVKLLCTNTLQVDKNVSKMYNTISQSISTEYNDINRSFKHISIRQCSVALCNSIVKDWHISKNNKSVNYSIDMQDKPISQLTCNNSEIGSHYNNKIEFAPCDRKRKKRDLKNNSFIKVEKLKIKKSVKGNDTMFSEKKQYMVSSTPIGKRVRPPTCSILFSPINTNTQDTLHSELECPMIISRKDISNIAFPSKFSDRKDSHSLIRLLKHSKFDIIDVQEQQTQILLLPQDLQTFTNSAAKFETISFKEEIPVAFTRKYNTECDIKMRFPHYSLTLATDTDQSQSLFDDTTHNHVHSDDMDDIVVNNIEKKYFTDALECGSTKADSANLSVDLCIEQKQLNYNSSTVSSRYESSFGKRMILGDLDNIMHTRQEYENEVQENQNIGINTIKTGICENFKDDSKHSFLDENQDNINAVDLHVLLTRLQDPIRITGNRTQYPKWHLNSISNTSESLNNEAIQLNKIFHYVATNEASNVQSTAYNCEYSKNMVNSSVVSLNNSIQLYNDTNKRIEKSVFLKPGKYWARSLSILNNINDASNLDKLSIGKGKKWRRSVKDILDMQKQGIFQTCLKKNKDDTDLSYGEPDASNVSFDRCGEFSSANHSRFFKRISVRVVPNNTSTKCNVKDAPFLEAFGIKEKFPILKLSCQEESLICDDPIIRRHSATARDVVLQRCSQDNYLSFLDCFPNSYMENCRKIGEGVYGEVFLHEDNSKKSVIKIIPIEGEQLVNGEPQKKFSEILSEIVIAKELDNLRLNATYKTNGFIEVRNINCVIGRYPEKLIKLWNIYDNDKTSDNDCPSMFNENQLYIVLELGHGGEDLEAFVFQTAEEACALFLQTALALAVAEKALEFEHRDLHWGNVLISRTKEPYIYYNLGGKEIKFPSNGIKVSIIDFTLSRMLYQGYCIYNDLALDPALFTAHGEYQFEIYRLMRDKIRNNWQKFEPYTNVLWLHYTLDKMITAVRYKRKNLKVHKHAIIKLKEFKDTILNYDSVFDFVANNVVCL